MSSNNGPLSILKKWLTTEKNGEQKLNKNHYILIVLILGIAFMLVTNFLNDSNQSTDPMPVNNDPDQNNEVEAFGKSSGNEPSSIIEYETYYKNQLEDVLQEITGVGNVSVVVNVQSTEKKVFERNVVEHKQTTNETDANGGKRTVEDHSVENQMVLIREGDKEVPLVSETQKPDIVGVLIVAKGADNIQVKKWIIEAVTRVLDVPSHRVSVQAKK